MRGIDDVVALYGQRRAEDGDWRQRAEEVRSVYNHDSMVPLPELDKNEKIFIANLLAQGIDQEADRIASTMPNLTCPSVKPGQKAADERANTRRKAILGWWSHPTNTLRLKFRRRARHLIGYASSPVRISPDFKTGIPHWDVLDPLAVYPARGTDPDDVCPPDTIVSFTRSLRWLQQNYPAQARAIYVGRDPRPEEFYTLLRYDDAEQSLLCVIAKTRDPRLPIDYTTGTDPYALLEQVPNRIGMCPVVHPGRIVLDRPQGQFDGLVGMYHMHAMMMALEVIATKRSIFPDEYLESHPNMTAKMVTPANGLTGQMGVVKDGAIRQMNYQPSPQAPQIIDRLERNARVEGGIPPEFGGESGSNIRTGRRGDAVLSAAVDFPIQAAQEILAVSAQAENRVAIAVAKSYFGNQRRSFFVPWKGARGRVDYVPNEVFETDENYVAYSLAGADQSSIIIGLGQRVGTRLMSKQTAREIDPLVDDAEMEDDRITSEAMIDALLASITTQAQQGAIPPADIARIQRLVLQDRYSLADAVTKAHEEAQERQAAQTPPGSPQAQPGLAQPGQGAEQPTIPSQMGSSMGNLSMLLQNLRGPQRRMPTEAGGEQALQAANAAPVSA